MLALGVATLGACGTVLAAALPSSTAMTAVGSSSCCPSSFSDVLPVPGAPSWMGTAGSFLPLKHVANSLTRALDRTGPDRTD